MELLEQGILTTKGMAPSPGRDRMRTRLIGVGGSVPRNEGHTSKGMQNPSVHA